MTTVVVGFLTPHGGDDHGPWYAHPAVRSAGRLRGPFSVFCAKVQNVKIDLLCCAKAQNVKTTLREITILEVLS